MGKKSIDEGKTTGTDLPVSRSEMDHCVESFQEAMNRLIDDFFTNFDLVGLSVFEDKSIFTPRIDMEQDETGLTITAELPGMTQDDIELTLSRNKLTVKGHKRQSSEDPSPGCLYRERSFGSFQRVLTLPPWVDSDLAEASFNNGILRISLPRLKDERLSRRKIPIKTD